MKSDLSSTPYVEYFKRNGLGFFGANTNVPGLGRFNSKIRASASKIIGSGFR